MGHRGLGARTYEPVIQGDVFIDKVEWVVLGTETALVMQRHRPQ